MSNTTFIGGLLLVGVVACASGGSNGSDQVDASVIRQDAILVTGPDAAVRLDGGVTPQPDAQVTPTPDAGTTSLFCSTHGQCSAAGECCLTLGGPQGFCAPGIVILGQCIPE